MYNFQKFGKSCLIFIKICRYSHIFHVFYIYDTMQRRPKLHNILEIINSLHITCRVPSNFRLLICASDSCRTVHLNLLSTTLAGLNCHYIFIYLFIYILLVISSSHPSYMRISEINLIPVYNFATGLLTNKCMLIYINV